MTEVRHDTNYSEVPLTMGEQNIFEQLGFTKPLETELPQRMIIGISGYEKTGKTHLALTGRPPIAVINLDIGLEGVVEKFQSEKDVWVYTVPYAPPGGVDEPNANAEVWKHQWEQMRQALSQVYAANPGTVIIDTMTEVYELARLANFGKLTQMAHLYGEVNAGMKAMVRQGYHSLTTTTILLSKMDKDYDTKEPRPKGWRDLRFHTQANIVTWRDPMQNGVEAFRATVESCRQNPVLMGMELKGDQLNVATYLEWLIREYKPE